jgi:hypothetical protein
MVKFGLYIKKWKLKIFCRKFSALILIEERKDIFAMSHHTQNQKKKILCYFCYKIDLMREVPYFLW